MDALTPLAGTAVASATPPSSAAKIASDFDTFLTLLTAQIRNQDPLEPADSTAYTAQLATFSNVEQAVQTNELLTTMIGRMDQGQASTAASWIGLDVRHAGPVRVGGAATDLVVTVPPGADRAVLVASLPDGSEAGRWPIPTDTTALTWPAPGRGEGVPDGTYRLHVESSAGQQENVAMPVSHYGRVEEVVLGPSGAELVLHGGIRLPATSMEAIRSPQTS
ncbi:flagellar hook capping FlgD N-terminal domain-containing protein [Jannaschia sp. KMU-145]|uniref:flagellar hook capping FlgD N-terminal domain-containing protein n=1 Tax=Jannaschia halovivens TaxID=3388667 RepID=UPI00396B3BC3